MNILNSPIKKQRPYNFLKLQLYVLYKKHSEKITLNGWKSYISQILPNGNWVS